MILIYTKEKYPKFLFDINLDLKTALEVTNNNLFIDNPQYSVENTIVIERDKEFLHPISDDLETIREMSREEVCATGDLTILQDGEKFEDGHIIQVPNPSTRYLKYSWDKETFTWKLITTKEELQQAKTNLILEHNKKRKEISALNEEAEFFDVSESVTKANDELEEIRAKITEIDKVIEEMNKDAKVQQ